MNAEALLKNYERIADAPDAVGRLRRFVLDLAVRGKLEPQDPSALSALSNLDSAVAAKRTTAKDAVAENVSPPERPFDLPDKWAFVRLGRVLSMINGRAFKPAEWIPDGLPIVRIQNLNNATAPFNYCDPLTVDERHLVRDGEFLISWSGTPGTSFGAFIWTRGLAALNQHIFRCIQLGTAFVPDFLRLAINSQLDVLIAQAQGGVGLQHVTKGTLEALPLPLPPLAEQHRIVAKVDELMALCDRLEAARAEREATRDRLAAASLARLNTPDPDPETFKAHASFAINTALPALTTRPDQIKQLRQTILNLAVRGHLEVSLASDGNASELLNAVEQLTGRPAQAAFDSAPFDLPSSWCWSSVGGLSSKTGSGSTPRGGKEVYKPSGVMFLRSQNIYDDGLRLNDVVFIDVETHGRMSGTAVADKDLLLNITGGSIGRCALVQSPTISANISQHVAIVRMAQSEMAPFVHLVIRSPYFQRFVDDEQTGAGRGGLPKNRMDPILVPVPPLAEQHRIVAKVDELMALCNQLEASLTQGANVRSHLLDALLHEALLPLNDKVIDFAAARQRLQEGRESIACRVVQRLGPTRGFGRVRAMKPLYWAEAHCGAALGGQWGRAEAGPFDQWIFNFEAHAASAGWFSVTEHRNGDKVTKAEYRAGTGLSAKAAGAAEALGSAAPEFERVLSLLADLNTEDSEIVTTLYAAWNDLLLEGKPFSDAAVITDVREHWHPSKARFTPALLQTWLDWLRKNRLVPRGQGPNTRHQPELI